MSEPKNCDRRVGHVIDLRFSIETLEVGFSNYINRSVIEARRMKGLESVIINYSEPQA